MSAGRGRWPLGVIVPLQEPTRFSAFEPSQWRSALHQVAFAGYKAVELAVTDPSRVNPAEVAHALASAGLRLSSLGTGQAALTEGLSLSSPDAAVRRRAVERIHAHMRFAAQSGAVVLVGLLRGTTGDPRLLVDPLRECAAHAPNVRLALEPINRYESSLVNTIGEALDLVDRLGAKNVGVAFDTFHANIEEADIRAAIRAAGDRLFHVHLADSNRWPSGHGHFDFVPVWDALEAIGYRGSLVLECFVKPDALAWLAAGKWIQASWSTER